MTSEDPFIEKFENELAHLCINHNNCSVMSMGGKCSYCWKAQAVRLIMREMTI
jgi:hypothetical protein